MRRLAEIHECTSVCQSTKDFPENVLKHIYAFTDLYMHEYTYISGEIPTVSKKINI